MCYCAVMSEKKIAPALVTAILCDDVRLEVGGKFSLMGLFEGISAAAFPVVHPRFAVWCEWTGGRGEFTATLRLLAPDGRTVLSSSDSRFSLHSGSQRHRDVSIRFNTTFPVPGTYWIEVLLDGVQAARVPLPVQLESRQNVH